MDSKITVADAASAGLVARPGIAELIGVPRGVFVVECFDRDGVLKWRDEFANTIMTAGKTDILDKYFKGSSYTAAWYVGLIDSTSYSAIAAGDTMSSHAGWVEATAYSESNRPTLTLGTVTSGSVDNSASKATFSINATKTIKGAFTVTNNTKGGTTGTLYNAALFLGGDRSVVSGDTLAVQETFTAS